MKLLLIVSNKLIILLAVLVNSYNAQSDYINHKKYWYYKTRFNNDFVKIGTGPGESIPFNSRGNGGNSAFFTPGQSLKSGDASAQLGCYLGVLATEYRLLKNNGQDLSKIKHEIFCALNAVNRIDYAAEPLFSEGTQSGNLNGFLVHLTDLQNSDFVEFILDDNVFHTEVPWYRKTNTIPNRVLEIPGHNFNNITVQQAFIRLVFTKAEDISISGKNFHFENKLIIVKPVVIVN